MKNIKRAIPALVFLAIAVYILMGFQDMLFTAHLCTPFISGTDFWHQLSGEPFGVMRWIGCWLTQTAYYPMLATIIYIIMWGVGYYCLERALHLPVVFSSMIMMPFACLLLGIIGTGYWIYGIRDWGYWFSQSSGLLIMLVLLLCLSSIKRKEMIVIAAVICILLYPILGWYSMLLSLCLLILNVRTSGWNVLPLIIVFLSPVLWHIWTFLGVSDEAMWLGGFPIIDESYDYAKRARAPYIMMTVLIILLCVLSAFFEKIKDISEKKQNIVFGVITVIVASVSYLSLDRLAFNDYNFQAEMRMSKYAMEDNWEAVIKEEENAKNPSRSMVLLQNIALLNLGKLSDQSFALGNDGIDIYNPDGIHVSAMHIVSPLVYYNYGKLNYAIRWAIEMSVGRGFTPNALMVMIRAAKAKGEDALANKYLDILHKHLFYKDWTPSPTSPLVKELSTAYDNIIDKDDGNVERYLVETFCSSNKIDSPTVRELCLFYAMIYREPNFLWAAFDNYFTANSDKPLPVHFQEAYCMYMNIAPCELPYDVKIDVQIQKYFELFIKEYTQLNNMKLDEKRMAELMKPKWGRTYWWHCLFGRNTYF